MTAELGPIWRSVRRHRSFWLLVLEVTASYYLVANLIVTCRYFGRLASWHRGHHDHDVIEIVSHGPRAAGPGRDAAAIAARPGVRAVVRLSMTGAESNLGLPTLFWGAPDENAHGLPTGCDGVERTPEGAAFGWAVEADRALPDVLDLTFIEGGPVPASAPTGANVVITRCLRDALFGSIPVTGQMLHSSKHPPARIAGVIDDLRLHIRMFYQPEATAIFDVPIAEDRFGHFLARTAPGRAAEVARATEAALGGGAADLALTARVFAESGDRMAANAGGTVLVLAIVTAGLCLIAVLGNLAIAAFMVVDRRRIIGIRRALGAKRWDIVRYLLIEGLIPTLIGNLLGLLATLATLRTAQSRFEGLELTAADVACAALILSGLGVIARLLPALHATTIPPSEASRAL